MPGAAAIPVTVANALSEREFEKQVIDLARQCRWECLHFHDSRREVRRHDGTRLVIGDKASAGFPDWILLRPPEFFVIEFKAQRGRLSDRQREILQLLDMCGVETHVYRPTDWPAIVERLTRHGAAQ